MLAVVIVHDALAAERLGFLALFAGAYGFKFDGAAVVRAGLLPRRLRLKLLQVGLIRAAGDCHHQNRWNYAKHLDAIYSSKILEKLNN